ncbi:MAG: alpha/beta hydrolase [Candidatus Hinthialibacter antarcticus]|nr:alpha/beta hydrolase [Candidatus Hinthialibacter antarcticus]
MNDSSNHSCMKTIHYNGSDIPLAYSDVGTGNASVFLHGWGANRSFFQPLTDSLSETGRCISIDLPGFGGSPPPPAPWSTIEYAECVLAFLDELRLEPCIIIGHSFGGRLAIRLAVKHPHRCRALVLIAAAGLRRSVPMLKKARIRMIQYTARIAKTLLPGRLGESIKQNLYKKIASRDYLDAGELRETFVKVVNEDLEPLLSSIQTPVLLLYGADDTETPPEFGRRMKTQLPNAQYVELPGFDHYSILTRGRHQVEHHITAFLKGLPQ